MTTEHPQAALLRAIADGKQMQKLFNGVWYDAGRDEALYQLSYEKHPVRIKPDTLLINRMEVPKPDGNPLKDGLAIDIALPWDSNAYVRIWHSTPEAARRHFDVLVAASKGETL